MIDVNLIIETNEADVKVDFASILHQVSVLEEFPNDTFSKDRIKSILNKYSK
jgi:hypothetical protein